MLRSIITTALRNVFRNKIFSLINLIGLVVSMSLSLLIILIVKEQHAFDDFHEDADRIYRINTEALRKGGGSEPYASSPMPIAEHLRTNYDLFDEVITLKMGLSTEVVRSNVAVPVDGMFTNPEFFNVFNFDLSKGNLDKALVSPRSLVLTEKMSEKLFGKEEAYGKIVLLQGLGEFTVTGIISNKPSNTHLDFEALASISTVPELENLGELSVSSDNWLNYYSSYNYVKLKEGVSASHVEEVLSKVSKEQYNNLSLESRDANYRFYLQNLDDITPGPMLSNQLGRGLPDILLIMLSILALIVMIMACFNYTHLTIAKSLKRTKEIGVRKVIGARRWQVFVQFIGESVVMAVIALFFSYLALQVLKPAFQSLHISDEFSVFLNEDIKVYLFFLSFALIVGLVSGIFPATYLSRFNPAAVLKGGGSNRSSKMVLRKVLMVIQLTFTVVFIFMVLVIDKQINYLYKADYGFNDENIVNIRLRGVEYEKFSNDLKTLTGVSNVSGISHSLGTWADRSSDYKKTPEAEAEGIRDFLVDENYLKNLEVEFLAGKNFSADNSDPANEKYIIINKKAVLHFGLEDNISALGQHIFLSNDNVPLQIIGVVENFNYRPLNYEIGPIIFRYRPDNLSILNIKMEENTDPVELKSLVTEVWKKHDPLHEMEWILMSDEIDKAYEDSGLLDVLKIVAYISVLAISIAFLGLLGMVMYMVQTRLKEIGIRKVVGAKVTQIVLLLNKSYLVLISIALIIGISLGYYLGDLYLTIYAFKISIGIPILITTIGSVLLIGLLIISSQTIGAAMSNPVKWLRNE